jgi:hypothetical protein
MRRKRTHAVRAGEIAKAAVLQGLLPFFRIWFTVPFRETITIGRKRVAICRCHRPPPVEAEAAGAHRRAAPPSRTANAQKAPARCRGCSGPVSGDLRIWRRAGRCQHRQGTRASANTSGPDLNRALRPGEIADLKIRTERRKLVSSAGPVFREASSAN